MAELREAAEAANHAWWDVEQLGAMNWRWRTQADYDAGIHSFVDEDVAFIAAASPQRVLALLDRVADLEAGIRRLCDEIARSEWAVPDDFLQALRALVGDETPGTGDGA